MWVQFLHWLIVRGKYGFESHTVQVKTWAVRLMVETPPFLWLISSTDRAQVYETWDRVATTL